MERSHWVPISEFKKLEAEMQEQSRIIGMSAEREAKLLAENERLKAQIEMLSTPHTDALDAQRIKDAKRYQFAKSLMSLKASDREQGVGHLILSQPSERWDDDFDAAMKGGE